MEAWRQGELESMSLCHSVTTNICLFEHFVCERVGGRGRNGRAYMYCKVRELEEERSGLVLVGV